MKRRYTICALVLSGLLLALKPAHVIQAAGQTYYVDCSAGSNGNGSQSSPWNNLQSVNNKTFSPGDRILFKRNTTCAGQLWPKGSGVSGNPITISAYGNGPRPIIDGNNTVDPVVLLRDQSYWVIDSLEVKNSLGKGVYVDGSAGTDLYYFRLTNLYVHHCGIHDGHDAVSVGMFDKHSVHDVVIDNVIVHNAFRGIAIGGKCCNVPDQRSSDITVRNSTVYDVENDGILVTNSNNVLVEYNVAYNTGLQPSQESHTPNAIWNWDTDNAIYQFNEAYLSHSPEWDGGAFDIDYLTTNTIYQYNYGHDNDAYCISIFGGESGHCTTNNVIRYNVCSNNARDKSYESTRQGDIYLTVWSGGCVKDSYIYNNTIYWNPAGPYSAIRILNIWEGKDIINTNIYNNIIYSASPYLVNVSSYTGQTYMDHNLYWYTGGSKPIFNWGGKVYNSFSAFQLGSGREAHGLYADPKLNDPTYHGTGFPTTSFTLRPGSPAIDAGADLVALGLQTSMGTRDFFGNPIPSGYTYDIGAYEYTNLLENAGFESGTTGWTCNNCSLSVVSSPVHSGSKAARVTDRTAAWAGPRQDITADLHNNGQGNYYLQAWFRMVSGSATAKATIQVKANTTSYFGVTCSANSTGWVKCSGIKNITWSGTLQSATFYLETTSGTASFYADDCVLHKE